MTQLSTGSGFADFFARVFDPLLAPFPGFGQIRLVSLSQQARAFPLKRTPVPVHWGEAARMVFPGARQRLGCKACEGVRFAGRHSVLTSMICRKSAPLFRAEGRPFPARWTVTGSGGRFVDLFVPYGDFRMLPVTGSMTVNTAKADFHVQKRVLSPLQEDDHG